MSEPSVVATPAENVSRVVGQTIQRAKTCARCGTGDDVSITLAVPLEEGGENSEWNHTPLCSACLQARVREQETGLSEFHVDAELQRQKRAERGAGRPKSRFEVDGRVFRDVDEAAQFWMVSKQTMYRWAFNGTMGARRL